MVKHFHTLMYPILDQNSVSELLSTRIINELIEFILILFTGSLPFSIRVLLESAVRNCDNFHVSEKDAQNILQWQKTMGAPNNGTEVEISFKPARVILQVNE